MDVIEFIDRFKDVVPYQLFLRVGGIEKNNRIKDKKYQSNTNFEGKAISFSRNGSNGENEIHYVPFDQCSLPVDIQVDCDGIALFEKDESGKLGFSNPSPMTKKDGTSYKIRLFNEKKEQLGSIFLDLNASGDILCKQSFYNNMDFTHCISQMTQYCLRDGVIYRTEQTTYTEKDYILGQEIQVEVYQTDGVTTGVSVTKKELKNPEELLFQSVTDLTKDFTSTDNCYFLSRVEGQDYQQSVFDVFSLPHENYVIQEDFTNFKKQRDFLNSLVQNEFAGLKLYTSDWEIAHYQNPKNDIFYGFVGEYTGNIIYKDAFGTKLVIRTSDSLFNYYTEIDLTGTDPFIGSSSFYDGARDSKYYERIENASRVPRFKTKKVNGSEVLVPQNGEKCSEQECLDFLEFQNVFLGSLSSFNQISVGKLLQK